VIIIYLGTFILKVDSTFSKLRPTKSAVYFRAGKKSIFFFVKIVINSVFFYSK